MDQTKKLRKLELLERKKRMQVGLPHLYGNKLYRWQREFYDSTNKEIFVCSANQIGKSSIQIKKIIRLATDPSLWKKFWPHRTPNQFWYLYPSSYVATVEFEKKWMSEFLPRYEYKDDPVFGWKEEYNGKWIQAIHFNSGISLYFKTYTQNPQDLQTGTVDYMGFDEELLEILVPELQARLFASNGYLSGVFTPTLGQEFWRETIEVRGYRERFPNALKLQVSMYDCLLYEDGTPSFWSKERIDKIKSGCKSEAEVQRRIYGKFVLDEGLKYPGFTQDNVIEPKKIPEDWVIYIGVDAGSGGKKNHPAAVTFTAMRPDMKLGYVFHGKRFDDEVTTASDVIHWVREEKRSLKNAVNGIFFDYSSFDMGELSARMGEGWQRAEKSHLIGEQILNVGFKNEMLFIFNTEALQPLILEFKSLKIETPKNMAHDDAIDSCRYSVSRIPWCWEDVGLKPKGPPAEYVYSEKEERRKFIMEEYKPSDEVEEEIEAYNELIDIYAE